MTATLPPPTNKLDISTVISSPQFKAASPEAQKALLLKHFPERYGNAEASPTPTPTPAAVPKPTKKADATKPFLDRPFLEWQGADVRGKADDAAGIKRPPVSHSITPRDVVQLLPSAAAMVATGGLAGAPVAAQMLAATGAGLVGNAAEQGVEMLTDSPPSANIFGSTNPVARMATAGLGEGLTQGVGIAAGKLKDRIARRLPSSPEEKAIEATADKYGIELTAGEIKPKLSPTQQKIVDFTMAARNEADKIGSSMPRHDAGRAVAEANKAASEIAHAQSNLNYQPFQGLKTDLTPHLDLIKRVPRGLLPPSILKVLEQEEAKKAAIADVLESVKAYPKSIQDQAVQEVEKQFAGDTLADIPFMDLKELRSKVGQLATRPPALAADTNTGLMKKLYTDLTGVMDNTVSESGLRKEWEAATTYHRNKVGKLFSRRTGVSNQIQKLAEKDPQDILKKIQPHDRQAVMDLNEIFDFARHPLATPEQRTALTAARSTFQRAFLDQKILHLPPQAWKQELERYGDDVLEMIYKDNPKVLDNIRSISSATAQLAPDVYIGEDVMAFLLSRVKGINTGVGSNRTILRHVAEYVTPSVKKTRSFVEKLKWAQEKGPNYIRGITGLGELAVEMAKNKPPSAPEAEK